MFSVLTNKIEITTNELRTLPPLLGGFLVASSFAIDEITQLNRMVAGSMSNRIPLKVNEDAAVIAFAQLTSVVRNLSAKLFEYNNLLNTLTGRARKEGNSEIIEFLDQFRKQLGGLRKGAGFDIATIARNKWTAHFVLDEACTALRDRDSDDVHAIYPNHSSGNSFYPLGEEIAFLPITESERIAAHGLNSAEAVNAWLGWVIEATSVYKSLHEKLLGYVLTRYFPRKRSLRIWVQLDRKSQVGILGKTRLPLWWVADR